MRAEDDEFILRLNLPIKALEWNHQKKSNGCGY
jgi:hypothetical protein